MSRHLIFFLPAILMALVVLGLEFTP